MVTPTLGAAFTKAIEGGRNLGPRGMPVTLERVAHVFEDGRIEVRGVRIPVVGAGLRGLRAGDQVAVSWQRGQPVAAIRHSARRSTPVTPSPRRAAPVVEEIFIAERPDDELDDVWFRNGDQCVPLHMETFGLVNNDLSTVRWGPDNNWFYVQTAGVVFLPFFSIVTAWHVFRIDRDANTVFPPGASIAGSLSLEYSWNPANSTMVIASIAAANQIIVPFSTPVTFTLTPANDGTGLNAWAFVGQGTNTWSAGAAVLDVSLDTDGNLIITYQVRAAGNGLGAEIPPSTFPVFECVIVGTVVADVRREVILFDTWSTGSTAQTSEALGAAQLCYNATDWTDLPYSDTVQTGELGERHCVIPTIPLDQRFLAVPTLVTNQAVNGWVGWLKHEFNNPVQTIIFGVPPPGTCTGEPDPPLRGLVVYPVQFDAAVTPWVLLPFETDASLGFVARSTYGHVVWSRASSAIQEFRDLEAGFGGFPGFATSLTTGITVEICNDLNADMGDTNMLVLPTDFVYQLDNPQVAFPSETPVNYFVSGWAFDGGAVTVNFADAPAEDTDLTDFKALAEIPEGVEHPNSLGDFDLQIVNAQSLETAGAFMELP
jgi:hypothetical protein